MKTSEAWAWWDEEEQRFRYVFPAELQVRVCFPDMANRKEAEGKGKVMPVTIIERKE